MVDGIDLRSQYLTKTIIHQQILDNKFDELYLPTMARFKEDIESKLELLDKAYKDYERVVKTPVGYNYIETEEDEDLERARIYTDHKKKK